VFPVFSFALRLYSLDSETCGVYEQILIADDRELMRVALRVLFLLRPNWKICGEAEAEDGRAAGGSSRKKTASKDCYMQLKPN
jgi:hypothetical protein